MGGFQKVPMHSLYGGYTSLEVSRFNPRQSQTLREERPESGDSFEKMAELPKDKLAVSSNILS